MPSWQSIRFRLSVQYSAVVFGLGGAVLGLVYLALRRWLRSQTMSGYIMSNQAVRLPNGEVLNVGLLEEKQVRAIESIYNEMVLDEVAQFTIIALVALFMLSLVVGWVMSGRALKPIEDIATVARDIQASDLSRRIDLDGPDDELTRLANTFDEMLERLDRAFSSQREFLADTSHDLRTPLAVMQSNVELVESDPAATVADWERAGSIVGRNIEKMTVMIDGLLAAARLQTGKAQAMTVNLASLVEAKAAEFSPVAAGKGVELEAVATTALIQGVEVSLDRALSNLLDNALKAAPARSVIRVGSGVVDRWAWIGVADGGPGLAPESDNIGLGLSIVSQIAQAHGGELASFPDSEGTGTNMVVWIPTADSGAEPPASTPFPSA